ncbi:Ser/Thr phosphatase family protein [Pseudomonas sp. StFLB209]|uniref:metallophosphoesterase n=1 Tax=Pseudomonas sp. StFLB209 TaxID=1028989 RepID=UPI0004F5BF6A|nr:metallophosphoesterase [Pseudomonas sp. StFLB209]BAP45255.1 Ser/Thr phosphatase family protein [Pseudomonas sp. StFLB209]
MDQKLLRLPRNTKGRDLVVGDIHFKLQELFEGLEALDFNPERDRLISVGDLIDRGPGVLQGLRLLGEPWFYMVQGNHERMLIDAWLRNPHAPYSAHGAEWWLYIDDDSKAMIVRKLQSLPIVIEIDTVNGMVGVLHADVPAQLSWQAFTGALDAPRVSETALWGRERIRRGNHHGVTGVWRVCTGHTRVDTPQRLGNVLALDCTGGGAGPLAYYCAQDDTLHYADTRRSPTTKA